MMNGVAAAALPHQPDVSCYRGSVRCGVKFFCGYGMGDPFFAGITAVKRGILEIVTSIYASRVSVTVPHVILCC
jgi:hypothetical protein